MKNASYSITPSKALRLIVAAALVLGICAPSLSRAHAETTESSDPRIHVAYGKGSVTLGTWDEQMLKVDGKWAYCVQVDKDFTAGLHVNAIDPVANGIWSQELCTRLALIDEVVWSGDFYSTSEAGNPSHRVTSNVEKYAIAQCYIWKALDDAGFSDYGWFSVAVDGCPLIGSDTDAQIRDYVNSHMNDYVGYASYYNCGDSQDVACSFRTEPAKGKVQLQKKSADEAFVEGNGAYSLEGAVYGIYESEDCSGDPVAKMTTDNTGHAESEAITRGEYFVKETAASPGYEIDETIYPVTIAAGTTATVNGEAGVVLEKPQTGGVKFTKGSALKSTTQDNALYSNEGAVFGIYADESCTIELARMTTGKQGTASAEGLPLGPKYVREISAPTGMAVNDTTYHATVRAGQLAEVGGGSVLDTPKSDAVKLLLAKHDDQKDGSWETNLPQGAATLEGAEFTVHYFDGYFESAEEAEISGALTRSWVFKTDSTGLVELDADHLLEGDALYENSAGEPCLPLGTVTIEETKPPRGYLPDTQIHCVQVTDDGSNDEFLATYEAILATDSVKRGDLEFVKVSSPGMRRLSGVPFMITSQTTGESHIIVTDDNGYASTSSSWNPHSANTNVNDALWADYAAGVHEDDAETEKTSIASTPANAPRVNAIDVHEGGSPEDANEQEDPSKGTDAEEGTTSSADETEPDEPVALEGQEQPLDDGKAPAAPEDEISKAPVPDNPTGAETEAEPGKPEEDTEANRDSADEEGPEDDSGSPEPAAFDLEAGIWFGLGDDGETSIAVDDARGALPYDTYTVTELACPANEGLQLIETAVVISRDNQVVDLGTLDDPLASIATSAYDGADGDGVLPCAERATLVDRVNYANLIPGREYTLCGTLMDKSSGSALEDGEGNPISATTTFIPDSSTGFVELTFEFSTLEYQESPIVVFEEVQLEGHTVAVHADIDDQDQSVSVARPAIGTSASDASDGDGTVTSDDHVQIVDHVSYSGLTPGRELELQGTLMDKASDAPLLVDGNAVESTLTFVPEQASGTVDMTFEFDASSLEDSTQLVVFEKLTCEGAPVASHEDLQDGGQTIVVSHPRIQTSLQDAATESKTTAASGRVHLEDTVSYDGLKAGREYEVVGTLMDKQTEKPALDAQGKPITSHAIFTPEETRGFAVVSFEFDGGNLGGHTLVAYESLQIDGREIAVHADLSDEEQSVAVSTPQIHTQAYAGEDGAKSLAAGSDAIIHDMVQVSGAKVDAEYTVVGLLMDKALGLPLVVPDQKEAQDGTATTTQSETDSVTNTAQLWSGMLKAADVGFTMKDSGGCIELAQATDIDYQAVGKAIEAHASEAERMALVVKTIRPQDSSFEVQMDFDIPTGAMSGQVVVFEALVENETGKLVAVHADFADTDQTLEITGKPTPAKGKPQAGSDAYDKTGNALSRYAWVLALLAAAGCAAAAYGIAQHRRE